MVPGVKNEPLNQSNAKSAQKSENLNLNSAKCIDRATFEHDKTQNHLLHKKQEKVSIIIDNTSVSIVNVGILSYKQCKLPITPTKKMLLALVNKLCSTNFARNNNGYINLTCKEIASYSNNLFTSRQVQCHLDDLINLGYLIAEYKDGLRWLSVTKEANDKFMPIIALASDQNSYSPSMNLVMSALLDKASFYARAGMDFVTDQDQMKSLNKDLYPLSPRSVRLALQKFKDNGLINYLKSNLRNNLLPVSISNTLTKTYASLFKITPSAKCKSICKNRAVDKILYSNPESSLTKSVLHQREQKMRMKQGLAQLPAYRAQTALDTKQGQKQCWNDLVKGFFLQTGDGFVIDCDHDQETLNLTPNQVKEILILRSINLKAKKGIPHSSCWQKAEKPTAFVGKNRDLFLYRSTDLKNNKDQYTDFSQVNNQLQDNNLFSIF